jgi:preprotein translocase subunit SecA
MAREDMRDRIFRNEMGKFKAVVKEIKERHEKGQPVLVGTISIEKNELLSELLEREGIPHQILNAKHHEKEAEIIAQAGRLGAVTVATNMAGRGVDIMLGGVPPSNLKSQISNLKSEEKIELDLAYKKWHDECDKVKESGGLHIIGTERHDSRRIDNQLRGRAGRQGDPGSSQFYLSAEDDLMRIFGGERLKSIMSSFNFPEDIPVENRVVSKTIESAQRRVEGHNFDIRKHLLEYDDVLNKHRDVIYKKRREILGKSQIANQPENNQDESSNENSHKLVSDSLKSAILEMVEEEIEQVVLFHTSSEEEGEWNIEEIYEVVGTIFPIEHEARVRLDGIKRWAGDRAHDAAVRTRIIEYLMELARAAYDKLEKKIDEEAGEGMMKNIERGIMIRSIDTLWVDHLSAIDYLRTGIGLRGYGQHDPLVEYKKESYRMFQELLHFINKQIVYSIYKVGLATELAPSLLRQKGVKLSAPAKSANGNNGEDAGIQPKLRTVEGEKVGRNDPCPCGATKSDGTPIKYKHCHGK